jgi:hypothetical protein
MSLPQGSDLIVEMTCMGDLGDFLRSGALPLRKIVVKHKECGLFPYEAEYVKEIRDERGGEYIRVIAHDRQGEEVILAQFCKEWVDSVEDQGPVNGAP